MKVIIGIPGCHKCHTLKEQHQDVKFVELQPAELIDFARKVGVASMPIVLTTDEDIKL